jgi:hypothetical protein
LKSRRDRIRSVTSDHKADRLCLLAQKIAERTPDFFETKGPGKGDRASAVFVNTLRKMASSLFGHDYSEFKVCKEANLRLDFYFPEEATAVEIALTLQLSRTEYELDIFKCLLAKEGGLAVRHLIFMGKPGAGRRQGQPGAKAIADFARSKFGLEITVLEFVPRVTVPNVSTLGRNLASGAS